MISLEFHKKLFIQIVLAFILFTIIGTLTHEYGHILAAKYFGYETQLHYGSMNYNPKGYLQDTDVVEYNKLNEVYKKDFSNIPKEDEEKMKKLLESIIKKYPNNTTHRLWIKIGGPLQTLLTSFLGLFLLRFFKSKEQQYYRKRDWLAVFLSLFALREVFNFVTAIGLKILFNKHHFYGDEFNISRILGYNQWVIPTIAMLLGLVISMYVVFVVLPKKYKVTFISSAVIGGILGFTLWFGYLGKVLLP